MMFCASFFTNSCTFNVDCLDFIKIGPGRRCPVPSRSPLGSPCIHFSFVFFSPFGISLLDPLLIIFSLSCGSFLFPFRIGFPIGCPQRKIALMVFLGPLFASGEGFFTVILIPLGFLRLGANLASLVQAVGRCAPNDKRIYTLHLAALRTALETVRDFG